MSKHTAGEWGVATVDNGHADDEIVTIIDGCMINIAAVFGPGEYSVARPDGKNEPSYAVSKEESAANARLISAAPELLAALERVARLIHDSGEIGDGMLITIVSEARAAIAKATGSET